MKSPQSPSPPHQYPQEIQLRLYQAFIFSIPILFSIILFLLFYLFYLKRRASTMISSAHPVLPRSLSDADTTANSELDLKRQVKNKLCQVLYDEGMNARDSLCCVCLGEFELKEELLQVLACKHIFHMNCIRHWLHNHSTCPLCRAPVVPVAEDKCRLPVSPMHHQLPPPEVLQHHHHHITILTQDEASTSTVA